MEKTSKTQKAGAALTHRVDRVEEHINLLLSQPLSEVYSKLPHNKKAQFQVLMAFSLNTLFHTYMKTQGSVPNNHLSMGQLERVQKYIGKIKHAEGKATKPSMQVNKDAAGRFIRAAIADDQADEKDIQTSSGGKRSHPGSSNDRDDHKRSRKDEEERKDTPRKPRRERMDPFKS
ncbi:hypothetical protein BCR43DRAFT_493803 [Syncephalastrum racemosum]|uniref:Exosome complex protein n=1 Tax=Syncephalastrum racemosum TaxID=13706 RepID=A0A1X2HB71_SYNRA|nr:hypothetical protein BCR43DRAFT_493803 [Syncephalastrum racemosum]